MVKLLESGPIDLPTDFGPFKVYGYSLPDSQSTYVALALVAGDPQANMPALVRVQSACLFGETFLATNCDCRAQLAQSMELMQQEGSGIIIYLPQEGRGVGLFNKIRSIELEQSQSVDTVEAYDQLGFAPDERDFSDAAYVLKKLGVTSVRLLTNSPLKITSLKENGIMIAEVIPLRVSITPLMKPEMVTKQLKLGHNLQIDNTSTKDS